MEERKVICYIKVAKYDELNDKDKLLVDTAKKQTENAYAPYSTFHVGAALELDNDIIVGGNNQENAAYPSGLCAERVAMFYANAQYPNTAVKTIAIAAYTKGEFLKKPITPCGSCRQVLLETENRFEKDITVFLDGQKYIYRLDKVKELLPLSFGKSNLLT